MRTDLKSYNNSWYKKQIGASSIKRVFWYFINCLFFINPYFPFSSFKILLLRIFGAKIGNGVVVKPSVNVKYPWKLKIGDYSWIGEKVWIDNLSPITIGSNVCISQGAMLLTGNHDYTKTTFDLIIAPIILQDGVWIGAQCVVCPGVTAFSHSVLSVQSVATKDMEQYSIYQGNPAIKIKERVIQ
ncbi:MAG: WcaF family extracellular polysaccharide biosynthesis acetyltransferase [Chitinophagaceae bacterium]|nr:WcaF family extracellular polysaccharide biosynthesis acetyltransferase [Chitinophagaceae bacterium]